MQMPRNKKDPKVLFIRNPPHVVFPASYEIFYRLNNSFFSYVGLRYSLGEKPRRSACVGTITARGGPGP
jgi:hypothetical protein